MTLVFTCFLWPSLYSLSVVEQAVLAVVSVFGLLFLALNAVLMVLFFRDNSPFSKVPFSSSVNCTEELRTITKMLLGLYGSFAKEAAVAPLVFGSVYLLLLAGSLYLMNTRPGLILYPFNRIYELGAVIPFWTLVMVFLQVVLSPSESVGFILWIVSLILLPMAWGQFQNRRETDLLTSHYKSLSSSNDFLAYNYACIRLANNRADPNNLMLLEGILSLHMLNCSKLPELCVCSRVKAGLMRCSLEQTR